VTTMDDTKLVRMVNQIGQFFRHEGEEKAAGSIARHLSEFWDPSMRRGIIRHLLQGGEGLDPASRRAVEQLAAPGKAA
jgi:formate dehydrogenase subunit delta